MTLIALLDHLGRQPGPIDLGAMAAGLDAPTRAALLARDEGALRRAFGDTRQLWCIVASPEDAPAREDAPGEGPGRDEPDGPEPPQPDPKA